ncbi:MAG: response regulator transcription factor [Acidobacteria bacterium]|nr:response regulator transcription factor [Acidobacteriota bacterium]
MGAPSKPIRVSCVDDHPLIIAGVKAILDAEADMLFAGGATSGADGIDLFRKALPDIVLVDLRLPDMPGTEVIESVVRDFPAARVIALTTYKGDADIQRAMAAGARSYLLKDSMYRELIDAIRRVHKGERYISAAAAQEIAGHALDSDLTGRELDVLRLMSDGNRNKEIAHILCLSEDTIKFHIKSILGKLGVHDRTHAVTRAIKRGILHVD